MPESRDRSRSRSRSRSPPPSGGGGGANASAESAEPMKLYIGNLSYDTDDNRLREEFGKFGPIDDVFLPVDRESNRPRGFGFVTFTSGTDANKAIAAMDGAELDGRTIKVSESRPRPDNRGGGAGAGGGGGGGGGFNSSGASSVKLFVGNLSFDTTEDTVRSLFTTYGEVTDCYMPQDRESGRPRGFAFVTMGSSDAENACGKVDGQDVDGRSIKVNEARAREDRGSSGGGGGYDRGGSSGGGGGYDRGSSGGGRGGDRDYDRGSRY